MTLVQSWIESLTLLKPKNAQLFVMVTIKSIIEVYKLLFYYWWWVIVLMIGCCVLPLVSSGPYGAAEFWDLSQWLYQLLFFATCLATRPSMVKKDCAYFRSYVYTFSLMLLLIFIPKNFWPTAFSPFYIFLILFFLDSRKGAKDFFIALWNSIKMIVYNFPLLVIIGCFFYLIRWLFFKLMLIGVASVISDDAMLPEYLWASFFVYNACAALLLPIGLCLYANIYIKKLHDQFDLYFPSP